VSWEDQDQEDPILEEFKAGLLGVYGPFDGWPNEAYESYPVCWIYKGKNPPGVSQEG